MASRSAEVNGRSKPRVPDSVQTMHPTENPFQSGEPSVASRNSHEWSKASSPTSQTFLDEEIASRPSQRSALGNRTPTQEVERERRVRSKSPRGSRTRSAKDRTPSIESAVVCRDFESDPRQPSDPVAQDIEERSEDSSYESAWDRQAALSFDGGGIRGYASLLMLRRLMKEVIALEQTHPNGPHSSSFDFDRPRVKPKAGSRRKHPNLKGAAPTATVDSGPSNTGESQGEQEADTDDSTTQLGGEEKNQVQQDSVDDDGPSENAFLPCHYFDFCGGTSTGGLIAIMLGRFRMPVDECLRQYEVLGKQVFGYPRKFSVIGVPRDKYSSKPVVNALKTLTMAKTPKDNKRQSSEEPAQVLKKSFTGALQRPDTFTPKNPIKEPRNLKDVKGQQVKRVEGQQSKFSTFRSPEDLCKVIAVATKIEEKHKSYAYVFRSYKPRFPREINFRKDWPTLNNPNDDNYHEQIWQVGRATSAAPTYFKAMVIGEAEFIDGALEYNNPSYELWKEIKARSRSKTTDTFQVFVSFGTGKPARDPSLAVSRSRKLVRPLKKLWRIGKHSVARLTDAEETHTQMKDRFRDHEMPDKYYRFNVDNPVLGIVELDEWIEGKKGKDDTLEFMRKAVVEELENVDTQDDLRKCAKLLVDLRRDRAYASSRKAASRWERFSKCVTFGCPRCEGGEYRSRVDFCSHLTEQHRSEWQKPSEQDEEGMRSFNERLDEHILGPQFRDERCVGPW